MNLGRLLFSFSGRINRAKYWLAVLIYFVVSVVAVFALIAVLGGEVIAGSSDVFDMLGRAGVGGLIVGVLLSIFLIVSGFAVSIKRLHDRNKSGWWVLLFYVVPGALQQVALGLSSAATVTVVSLASFALTIWALVELGVLRGTDGPNRYGPDPLAR